MRLTNKVAKDIRSNSKGVSLIEVLVALAILGIIAAAFLGGLATGYKAVAIANERTNAESLTRSELEYIRNTPYSAKDFSGGFSYEISTTPDNPPPWDDPANPHTLDSHYAGYSVNVTGMPIDPKTHDHLTSGIDQGMQEITVQVYHQVKLVLTTSSYKVNR